MNAGEHGQVQFEPKLQTTLNADDVQLLQLVERVEGERERTSASYSQVDVTETKMLEVGEDRLSEGVEERGESGRADEVLGECPTDPSTLFTDEPHRLVRKAETLHSAVGDLLVAASGDGSQPETVLQTQVVKYLQER